MKTPNIPEWLQSRATDEESVWTIYLDGVVLGLTRTLEDGSHVWRVESGAAGLTPCWMATTSDAGHSVTYKAESIRIYLKHVAKLAATMRHLL